MIKNGKLDYDNATSKSLCPDHMLNKEKGQMFVFFSEKVFVSPCHDWCQGNSTWRLDEADADKGNIFMALALRMYMYVSENI